MEDGLDSLFAPDVLTPSQWRDTHTSGDDPIKRLLFALLKLSLEDAAGARRPAKWRRWNALREPRAIARAVARRSQRAKALRREAIDWIFDESADGLPFAFVSVCETLGIDAERLRARERTMERQAA